jgi:hypothetical protein
MSGPGGQMPNQQMNNGIMGQGGSSDNFHQQVFFILK